MNLNAPTIANMLPARIRRWNGLSVTNAPGGGAKLTRFTLNIQTPCPPRGAVPVTQALWEALSLSTPGSLSVMDATVPAMSPKGFLEGRDMARRNLILKTDIAGFNQANTYLLRPPFAHQS
jgi:hypothetical protein